MNKIKNPDLLAALACLAALITVGAIYAFTGQQVIGVELQAALGAFVLAALTRWRLGLKKPAPAKPEAPEPKELEDPVTALITEDGLGDSGEDTEVRDP